MFLARSRRFVATWSHIAVSITSMALAVLFLVACAVESALPEPAPLQQQSPLPTPTQLPQTQATVGANVITATLPVAPPTVAAPDAATPTANAVAAATATTATTATTLPNETPITATATISIAITLTPDLALTMTVVAAAANLPETAQTSTAVVATITALAATPTYPPTSTARPRRRPIIIGAAGDAVPPTTAPDQSGVTVQAKSQRVFPGGPATLTIKTQPNAACELSNIRVRGDGNGVGVGMGKEVLEPISSGSGKRAGRDGIIAWIWTVDSDEPMGPMRLVIDCRSVGVNQITMEVSR